MRYVCIPSGMLRMAFVVVAPLDTLDEAMVSILNATFNAEPVNVQVQHLTPALVGPPTPARTYALTNAFIVRVEQNVTADPSAPDTARSFARITFAAHDLSDTPAGGTAVTFMGLPLLPVEDRPCVPATGNAPMYLQLASQSGPIAGDAMHPLAMGQIEVLGACQTTVRPVDPFTGHPGGQTSVGLLKVVKRQEVASPAILAAFAGSLATSTFLLRSTRPGPAGDELAQQIRESGGGDAHVAPISRYTQDGVALEQVSFSPAALIWSWVPTGAFAQFVFPR